ncbi:hypothetical protein BHM03_00039700 [Ensete ventricosum]|nr:hypothetical protein BHM03_00039700 [Ensete ventricosum]
MKKEGSSGTSFEAPCGRITRARAAACRANGKLPPLMPSVANTEKKQTRHSNLKRAAFDENSHGFHPAASQCKKKRAVLTDVTNMFSQNSSRNWLIRRPVSNFMETLQRDITESMRGILIDWLVEVC